jgi:hypothetical protein
MNVPANFLYPQVLPVDKVSGNSGKNCVGRAEIVKFTSTRTKENIFTIPI